MTFKTLYLLMILKVSTSNDMVIIIVIIVMYICVYMSSLKRKNKVKICFMKGTCNFGPLYYACTRWT